MSDSSFSIREYRKLFLEKIGFPLIKANAKRFLDDVGDLRCLHAVKQVFEAAMRWLSQQQEQESKGKKRVEELEAEVVQVRSELETKQIQGENNALKIAELELQIKELESATPIDNSTDDLQPEDHLALYLADTTEDDAEKLLMALIHSNELAEGKTLYHRLVKAFHPDTSCLPTQKANELFTLFVRLHEETITKEIVSHVRPYTPYQKTSVRVATESQLVDDDIEF